MPKWWRLIALQSTFAPQSQRITFLSPFTVGSIGASAGREMPLILPTFINAPTKTAPVEPADTSPPTSSSAATRSNALTSELSFLRLIAVVGTSSLVMISFASTTVILSLPTLASMDAISILSVSPTRITSKPKSFSTASRVPFTISSGARSPPIASTTIL